MLLQNLFRASTRSLSRRSRPQPARPVRPRLECLEDRTVPTILFGPRFGAETLVPPTGGGTHYTTLSSPPVYLIFWGSYWSTPTGAANANTLGQEAQTILGSTYLNGLTEYGSNGHATFAARWSDPRSAASDPPAGFNAGDPASATTIQNEIVHAINDPTSPILAPAFHTPITGSPIYVVVTDPNHAVSNGGYNLPGTYTTTATPINMISVGTGSGGMADSFGLTFSHEMAERMSDPTGDSHGVTLFPPAGIPSNLNGGLSQIGDNEPEPGGQPHYNYRLSGVTVQPYWSNAFRAFIVPDGNSQRFNLAPRWQVNTIGGVTIGTFNGTSALTITGDQFASHNDTITLDVVSNGVRVTLNGQVVQFDPGAISSVQVESGDGSDSITVRGTPVSVTVNSRGNASVGIGNGGRLNGILAAVTVVGAPNHTDLTIDDSADTFADRSVTLSDTSVTISPVSVINYSSSAIHSLILEGGPGQGTNHYDVYNTPAGQTTIRMRGSNDFMQIHGDQGPLAVGGFANNSILVTNNGLLNGILAPVSVSNIGGLSAATLTIDDSADHFADRLVTLTDTALTVQQPGIVTVNYSAITSLTYEGSPGSTGSNVYQVLNTPACPTTIRMRGSNDFMQIHGDQGPLAVGGFANNSVLVGDASSLGRILAPVSVSNIPGLSAATLTVDDSADHFADRLVTLTDTALTVQQPGIVTVNYSAITSLTYEGSPGSTGSNLYQVLNTPACPTTIRMRGSNDFMQIHGDQGPLAVGGFANNSVLVTDNGLLSGILAPVTVANIGGLSAATLTIDDSADHFADRLVTLTDTALTVQQPGIVTVNYSAITSLTYEGNPGSTGSNLYQVLETPACPTTVRTRGHDIVQVQADQAPLTIESLAGGDTLDIGAGSDTLAPLLSPVTFNGRGAGNGDTINVIDQNNLEPETYTVTDTALSTSAGTVVNYNNFDQLVLYPSLVGNTITDTHDPALFTFLTSFDQPPA